MILNHELEGQKISSPRLPARLIRRPCVLIDMDEHGVDRQGIGTLEQEQSGPNTDSIMLGESGTASGDERHERHECHTPTIIIIS